MIMWNNNGLLNLKDCDRILVVAPHADDECIGCGGLLLKYAAQTDVLLLSDGRYGINRNDPNASPEETRILRQKEFHAVMSFLKIRKLSDYNRKVEEALANGEDLFDPTWKAS